MERYNVKPTIEGPPIVISDDDDDDNKNTSDSEVPKDKSNDSEVLKDKSNDSEVPKDKSNDSEVPKDKSSDSEVPKDKSSDSDVPDDDDNHDSDDSDVPDDDDNHDSDVPDDDDNHDSDVPDDEHDSDVSDDDNGHDSDVPDEDSSDSDVPSDSNDWEVPDNNTDDFEVPVPAEEDLCDEGQIASDEEELDEAGEQDLGENLCDPLSDPEANLEVSKRKLPTEEEPAPVVEQSGKRKAKSETIVEPLRKRKAKTKNVSETPADKGHKKCGHSKKKPSAAKVENCKTRTCKCKVHRSFLYGHGKSKKYSGKNLERNKDELVHRVSGLFNRTDCDKKLQEKRRIASNNKMLKTADSSCSSGEMPYQNRQCIAEIQLGVKVSAMIQIDMQPSTGLAATPNHSILGASSMSSSRRLWSWCH
ncbi:uncharacterized protein GCNA isoform X1 [Saimiri boliviensis]|uniref:uncharacterized protein GCNA isoform X1 n=1 Tax=Saimiri boliviensis TaxID=27679 RepID=UPI003D77B90F